MTMLCCFIRIQPVLQRKVSSQLITHVNHSLDSEYILESIFAELDRKTLLNCRLVSLRWVHFSSISLQKIITLQFKRPYKDENSLHEHVLLCNGQKDQPIKNLVTLMNHSTNFPCRSFLFNNYYEEIESLAQRFFNAHGTCIKKLEFEGFLLLSDLKRLFLSQTPNLEQLVLSNVEFTHTESEFRLNKSDTPEEGRLRKESLYKETTVGSGPNKPVLKNLSFYLQSNHP